MGNCMGGGGDEQDRAVQSELAADRRKDSRVHKLLLLGAGGSGKSTFFKQLKTIHGDGHSAREREGFRRQIYGQVIDSMQILIRQCQSLTNKTSGDEEEDDSTNMMLNLSPDEISKYEIDKSFDESCKHVLGLESGAAAMDPTLAQHISKLWTECEGIKNMFEHRNKICVPDSTAFFMDNLERISRNDYLPTDEDVLLVRYRTTGMTEKQFVINQAVFKIHDVGGQRNERKKWIHFFDGVTAVLFVVSLSCYDEVPFEDVTDLDADVGADNNMLESVQVFKTTLNERVFEKTGFILFLNKRDIMEEKIKRVPITTAFPEYTGPQEFGPSVEYIRDVFVGLNSNPDREMFAHVTTATDTKNVERLFNDVQQCVVNWSLKNAGLV